MAAASLTTAPSFHAKRARGRVAGRVRFPKRSSRTSPCRRLAVIHASSPAASSSGWPAESSQDGAVPASRWAAIQASWVVCFAPPCSKRDLPIAAPAHALPAKVQAASVSGVLVIWKASSAAEDSSCRARQTALAARCARSSSLASIRPSAKFSAASTACQQGPSGASCPSRRQQAATDSRSLRGLSFAWKSSSNLRSCQIGNESASTNVISVYSYSGTRLYVRGPPRATWVSCKRSLPAEQQVQCPAAAHVVPGAAEVGQQVLIGTAGVLQGVGEDRQRNPVALLVDGRRQLADGAVFPRQPGGVHTVGPG